MSIETPDELEHLKAAGRVVAEALRAMRPHARPGVTTGELDDIGARVFARAGARSGPQLDYGFPGVNCISVNDEAVHGIPGRRRLRDGDVVKLDVTAELDGFYADACVSVPVGETAPSARRLAAASRAALNRALAIAGAGTPVNRVGRAIETTITKHGYAVCPDLIGHSIGRRIHEPPNIPNYDAPGFSQPLTEGVGDHDRADHRRWRWRGPRDQGRMDNQDSGWQPQRAHRAHHRHHPRSPADPHRLRPRPAGRGGRSRSQTSTLLRR